MKEESSREFAPSHYSRQSSEGIQQHSGRRPPLPNHQSDEGRATIDDVLFDPSIVASLEEQSNAPSTSQSQSEYSLQFSAPATFSAARTPSVGEEDLLGDSTAPATFSAPATSNVGAEDVQDDSTPPSFEPSFAFAQYTQNITKEERADTQTGESPAQGDGALNQDYEAGILGNVGDDEDDEKKEPAKKTSIIGSRPTTSMYGLVICASTLVLIMAVTVAIVAATLSGRRNDTDRDVNDATSSPPTKEKPDDLPGPSPIAVFPGRPTATPIFPGPPSPRPSTAAPSLRPIAPSFPPSQVPTAGPTTTPPTQFPSSTPTTSAPTEEPTPTPTAAPRTPTPTVLPTPVPTPIVLPTPVPSTVPLPTAPVTPVPTTEPTDDPWYCFIPIPLPGCV